ncbi:Phage repressor protein C, contains Cro/C1-type HTH and peptisase s24 domains [Gilliamella bombicola]|uniref:Phage repressor protein C, contains Cro/C1-type HTH and peptisase s24 domains n=1 Tax=Gilliamella bombicola TaxID=1798182 RepID=A0A1C4A493_9GAMM|nr:S24 family peptidase [Gilliamella bombicola]SCB89363.1 Phage repressor protein C, contains Cro/C1-type HTH and peptisase s24 domains [Gilliamella bombicola]
MNETINNKFKDRLHSVMMEKGLGMGDVSKGTGINYEMIRRYAQGTAIPRNSNLDKISKFLKVDKSWLLFGNGDSNVKETITNKNENSFYIEVLDITASAGAGYLNSDVMEVIKLVEYDSEQAKTLFKGVNANNLKVINVSGDSMQGTFESGDAIYVDVSKRAFEGDGIYVFTFGRNLYVKRLQIIKNIIRVKSDNKLYDSWEIHEDEFDQLYIHGKVMLSQSMLLRKHG